MSRPDSTPSTGPKLRTALAWAALALLQPVAGGQGAWRAIEDGAPVADQQLTALEFGGHTRLVAEGERLLRVGTRRANKGQQVELACTDPGGPGNLRHLAPDPAGLTWIAADRGLFLTGIDVQLLDRVDLAAGAPPGTPTSSWVDAERRVWLATEDAFGVIDPSFFWGRTFELAGELPGPGPYRILRGEGRQIVVQCAAGIFSYTIGGAPPPAVSSVALDGAAVEPGSLIGLEHGARPRVTLEGAGLGGVTFRYRFDDHHVWRALASGDELVRPRPGRFRLQIVALDRELNRSEPFELFLEVAYPFYAEKRFAALALASSAALVLALFLLRARRRGGGLPRYGLATFSAGLLLVLLLQLLAGVVPHARGWPFIGFAMYTQTNHEDDIIYEAGMLALKQNGRRQQVYEWDLGVTTDGRWQVLRPLIDGGDAAGRDAVAKLNQRWPRAPHFDGILVRARRIRLTRQGPVEVAPMVLGFYREERPRER